MRVYTPPKNRKNAVCSFLSMLCGSVFFICSYFMPSFRGIAQLAAFGFWSFAMWIACRYMLTSYYYVLEGANFRIVKVTGKNHQDVGNISMTTVVFLKKASEAKDRPPVKNRFDYCSNFMSEQKYVYSFEWNGTGAEIIFEASAEFAAIMQDMLEAAKSAVPSEPTNGWYDE